MVSSTGAGDPPDSIRSFWRKVLPKLTHAHSPDETVQKIPRPSRRYTLYTPGYTRILGLRDGSLSFNFLSHIRSGLGDSNYDTFQGFPTALYKHIRSVGAKEFYPRGEADDGIGYGEGDLMPRSTPPHFPLVSKSM